MKSCDHFITTAALSVLAVVVWPAVVQAENLLNNDKALMQFVMPKDWEFGRVLGPCENLKVRRSVAKGQHLFRILGNCGIKNALAPDEDCHGYSFQADGTIDTSENATIRKITLRLLCSG